MAYGWRATCTVDASKVSTNDQANFAVLVSTTIVGLKTVGNGGNVVNTVASNNVTVPADLAFFSDAALTTKLKWEVEKYDATTGLLIAWVLITSLSHTVNTVFYLAVGDAAVTTFQGDVNGTWNSAFKAVWHMQDGASSSSINDSTVSALTLTKRAAAHPAQNTGAQIGNGEDFVLASSDFARNGTASAVTFTTALTLSCWVKSTSTTATQDILHKGDRSTNPFLEYALSLSGGKFRFSSNNGTSTALATLNNLDTTAAYANNTWTFVACTWDGTTKKIAVNGTVTDTAAFSGTLGNLNNQLDLGLSSVFAEPLGGSIDEIRLANTARPADWLLTEFNNQNSPSTFVTFSGLVPLTVGAGFQHIGNIGSVELYGGGHH